MKFTYQAYRDMLSLLREQNYAFRQYHNYADCPRCVILRHDIDNSLEQAVKLAQTEAEAGVVSTYFVLLRTDFYNIASRAGLQAIRRIQALGHEIGLHFDETAYTPQGGNIPEQIIRECGLLSALLETTVSSVSMHRPSRMTLEADFQIPGIINSYGKTFFRDFKYLSDSRRNWREPVLDIIRSGAHDRLHILTHAFWYHGKEETLEETVRSFIRSASRQRYRQMADNITDIASIMREDESYADR